MDEPALRSVTSIVLEIVAELHFVLELGPAPLASPVTATVSTRMRELASVSSPAHISEEVSTNIIPLLPLTVIVFF